MSERTGTMEGVDDPGPKRPRGAADAGLVLLYAPNHDTMPSVLRLTGETIVIGREPPPGGFAIDQTAVSRVHARISEDGGAFTISDAGSRNGVLVNGRFVQEQVLSPDDVVRIGDAIFKFVADDAVAYTQVGTSSSGLVGGRAMHLLTERIATIATTDLPVVVTGETGTGKELAARAIHDASGRRGPLMALNCAAIPANLVESELFGYKRGAFSGADRDHVGIVRAAEGGTLLLDEIGDMPLDAQAKLLRMIETRTVMPLGATREAAVDVRVVCATHRDLHALVEKGAFRGDLFARLDGFRLRMPALRERKEDLFPLVRHFVAKAGRAELGVTVSFMAAVCHYAWPYNVRELETATRRAVAVVDGHDLDTRHLPEPVVAAMESYASREVAKPSVKAPAPTPAPTADELRALLDRHGGNISAAARELGKDRVQIHRWMRLHGIRR
jgi:DNA-binding NtrC family response regulator